jgi:hypothetical protein
MIALEHWPRVVTETASGPEGVKRGRVAAEAHVEDAFGASKPLAANPPFVLNDQSRDPVAPTAKNPGPEPEIDVALANPPLETPILRQ